MDKDIVPELLESIQEQFNQRTYDSKKLKMAINKLRNKKASYLDVNDFAIEIGNILADVLSKNITVDVLPDGKMYFNIADRVLNSTMKNNHSLISDFAVDVQTQLNHEAGLRLKGQAPELNQDRIDGIINRVASENDFDAVKWILDDPIINFSQSVVDDVIRTNVDFHFEAGLAPKITRRVSGHACDWCKRLAGTYNYHEEPADIYRRHERCRCTVEYNPKDSRGIQNSHTKEWRSKRQQEKIKQRKTMNLRKERQ
ncbi:hypothetical protein I6N96_08950 [Enterococcus sp. BWM-S5]|uniref:Gp35 n=1 Tax=Enterococcus larvae TaxID=2794352 RepID=A0ABS4CII3_9ENTE|nr:hypothetical protein [Enterococcus larvae]MBP1046412.1 hypothetical protein [Enterococcus larvae]